MIQTTKQFGRMAAETNEANIGTFKALLPYFLYTDDSNGRIMDVLNGNRTEALRHTDSILHLDDQLRAWYAIPVNEEDDNAYKLYLRTIGPFTPPPLTTYDTFISGRTPSGEKLFKYLLKNKHIEQSDIDRINALKNNESNMYFCISRNPIDYLMASTNQPWSSCMSLESCHSDAFYYSLASLVLDPSRAISFVTPGKLRTYENSGYTIKHFRYDQRQFIFVDRAERIFVDRVYPATKWDVESLLFSLGFSTTNTIQESYYPYHPATFPNGERALPYLDKIGITRDGIYSTEKGARNDVMSCLDHGNGFFDFPDFDDLCGKNRCENCGGAIDEGDEHQYDGTSYCSDCFWESYSRCEHCDEIIPRDEAYYVDSVGSLCEPCFDNNYFTCDKCGESCSNDEHNTVYYHHGDEYSYCDHCVENYTHYCDDCEKNYMHEVDLTEVGDKYLCPECLSDGYYYCDGCEKYVENSEFYHEEQNGLCRDCLINDHGYLFCYHCKTVHPPDTVTEIDDKTFCETCLANRVYCFKCRSLHHNNDIKTLNNVEIMPCEALYKTLKKCPVCSEYHTEQTIVCEYCENERVERIYSYVA